MQDDQPRFFQALKRKPLMATLGGLVEADALAIGQVLQEAGWALIEVPLNSPQPYTSIEHLAQAFPQMVVGAGMVMSMGEVRNVRAAGGAMVVSPHMDVGVIRAARDLGLICLAGVATPTEAVTALLAGATALQIFPVEMVPPATLRALHAMLPPEALLLPAGGVTLETLGDYVAAGANGFAVGAALYRPGDSAAAVAIAADVFATALETALEAASARR
jgi:2-dehydro-3-deoxyphosphogalactonate aldolase